MSRISYRAKEYEPLFEKEQKIITDAYSDKSDIVFALGDSLEILSQCPDEFRVSYNNITAI